MVELKNRRLKWSMGRTISMGPKTFEFTRLDVSEEADVPDGVPVVEGYAVLAKDVVQQITLAETAVRQGKDPLPVPFEEYLYEEE